MSPPRQLAAAIEHTERIGTAHADHRSARFTAQADDALVGAGGKTTLMFRLARELAAAGYRVVTSTTTRLAVHETTLAPECIVCEEADRLLAALPVALARHRHVLAVECVIPEKDRVGGLTAQVLERIATLPDVDFLLVEADGSHGGAQGPAPHEPVIPGWATVVMPVVGLDVLGCPSRKRMYTGPSWQQGWLRFIGASGSHRRLWLQCWVTDKAVARTTQKLPG